jgi:phosphoribosylanthranilate isomerase
VQLHFDADPGMAARLRARFGDRLRILRVVHFDAGAALPELDASMDGILVDSRTDAAVGGTGKTFDWAYAGKTLFRNARERKLIAAGGLSPDNVAEAIAMLRPWGVDVVSGVETAPGRKDAEKVRAFISNARAAAHRG